MPPPTVQPVRVSLASNCSLNTGMNAEYLSPAHAAPPLAYNSQRSHAQPSRPVALAIQSVWARAVPVIPRTVCVISPLMSLPDPSPSMPMTQLLPNWRLQPTWPPPRKPLVSPVTETPGANEGTETVFSPHPPPRCPPIQQPVQVNSGAGAAGGARNLAPRSAAEEEFPMKTVPSTAVASNALFIEAPRLTPKNVAHRLSLR